MYTVVDPSQTPSGHFANTLKFVLKEVENGEAQEDGYPDEYPIDELDLCFADFMIPSSLASGSFPLMWEELADHSVTETLTLSSMKTVEGYVLLLFSCVYFSLTLRASNRGRQGCHRGSGNACC